MPNHCYNRLTITTDDYGLLIQMRDAALMENCEIKALATLGIRVPVSIHRGD